MFTCYYKIYSPGIKLFLEFYVKTYVWLMMINIKFEKDQ